MKLRPLTLGDKKLFNRFLGLAKHELAVYAFENIYIWKGLFDIYWAVIEENLCVFFKNKTGCFLYIPPQGSASNREIVDDVFRVMDGFNENKDISRIENAEKDSVLFYQDLGLVSKEKFGDYLYERADLADLRGDRFKHKRASYNYFVKHYKFEYLPFSLTDKNDCFNLHAGWLEERRAKNQNPIYQAMLEDSQASLKVLLNDYAELNFTGRVVKTGGAVKAFTFGFKLSSDTFCILYEIAELSLNGLSQFIFRELCRELTEYEYINIMDDSGLADLKRVKGSYHPTRLVPAYIITRKT